MKDATSNVDINAYRLINIFNANSVKISEK